MTDEQAGKLFKAISAYQEGEEIEMDMVIKMAFLPFKNQFIRDAASYEKVVIRNQTNGKNGGRPKNPKEPNGLDSVIEKTQITQTNPNNLDSDKDKDNVTDKKEIIAHPLQAYVKNLIQVSKMKYQLTVDESDKLIKEYPREAIKEVLEAMDNKKTLLKDYLSVYKTANNWLKRRNDNNMAKTTESIKPPSLPL